MEDRGGRIIAVAILFFVLAYVAVGLRVCARFKAWGKDDSAMVLTLFLFTIYLVFQIVAATYGSGRHRWDLEDDDARKALLFWYLAEVFYIISNCALKIAIGMFMLRVAVKRWHLLIIKNLMAGTVLFGMAYLFLVIFQCRPLHVFWTEHPAADRCLPKKFTIVITYALASVNAAADWTLGILPFFIVWDLQMKFQTKMLAAGILAFAAIGSTGTVVRMFYIPTLVNGTDFLYATTDIALWSTVEPGIGITAASIATLRPLLQKCFWHIGLARSPTTDDRPRYPGHSSSRNRWRKGYSREFDVSELVPDEGGNTEIVISGGVPKKSWSRMNRGASESGKDDGSGDENALPGIKQSVLVKQEIEGIAPARVRQSWRLSLTKASNDPTRKLPK